MTKATVLIVEDDTNIREMYEQALSLAEMKVFTANNGKDGIALALEHHPDAILMDIAMQNMNGHEAVMEIRKDTWGKNAKVIFLTNFSDPENVVHAIDEGSEEFIIKANTTVKEVVNKVRVAAMTK